MVISVIVFSKDRPFQLGQYLRTLFRYTRNVLLKVCVVAKIQEDYEEGYKRLAVLFPQVYFIRETNFSEHVKELVESVDESDFVIFGVDDALFCAEIPWSYAVDSLSTIPRLQCVHLKLSPGLVYCHPAASVQVFMCVCCVGQDFVCDYNAFTGRACIAGIQVQRARSI